MADSIMDGGNIAPADGTRSNLRRLAWLPALAGLLVFLPALGAGFVYDDHVDVAQVDAVFTPGAWPQLFSSQTAQLYRPLKYLAFHLENAIWGWHAWGFHLANVLLHAATCFLLFPLIRRLGPSPAGACAGALWFALHPVHTEAVVWISNLSSLLSALGTVACLLGYMRWREKGKPADLVLLGVAGFVGFFSKEDMFMIFPVIVAAEILFPLRRDSVPGGRSSVLPLSLLLLIAAAYATLRQTVLTGLDQGIREHGWIGLASTLPVILARYIVQLFYPPATAVDQPVDYLAGFDPVFWVSTIFIAVLLASWFQPGRRAAVWRFSIAWFFLFLVPVMGLIPINQPMADRFLYIPSMAGAFLVGAAWDKVTASRPGSLPAWKAALAVLLAVYAVRCVADTRLWKNDTALWSHTVRVNPRSYRGFNNLAVIANNADRPAEGLALVDQALAIKPHYPEAWVTKAFALDRLGRSAEAEALYRQALAQVPDNTVWMFLLADLMARSDRQQEAKQMYDAIFALRPGYLDARLAAGLLAIQEGDVDKAIEHWEIAARSNPNDTIARHNLELAKRQKAAAH